MVKKMSKKYLFDRGVPIFSRWYKLLKEMYDDIQALKGAEITYFFTSYLDASKTTKWGTGTAQTTGVTDGDFVQLKVLTNVPEDPENPFINKKIFVNAKAPETGRVYKLYESTQDDKKGDAIEVWVTIGKE